MLAEVVMIQSSQFQNRLDRLCSIKTTSELLPTLDNLEIEEKYLVPSNLSNLDIINKISKAYDTAYTFSEFSTNYYDTPNKDLMKAGYSFRERKLDNRWDSSLTELSVKGDMSSIGGLCVRHEENVKLNGMLHFDDDIRSLFKNRKSLKVLENLDLQSFEFMFTTIVKRNRVKVVENNVLLDISVDSIMIGHERVGLNQQARELEIEYEKHKDYNPTTVDIRRAMDLFIAKIIDTDWDYSVITKAERGYESLRDNEK